MQTNILYNSLLQIGLSDTEARVYLSALNHKNQTIVDVAKDLGVERPTIYAALKRLSQVGLVQKTKKPYQRHIPLESPERVVELIKRKKTTISKYEMDLKNLLPDLLSTFHAKKGFQKVKFYEGRDEFVALVDRILDETRQEILYMGSAELFVRLISPTFERDWIRRRVVKGIQMRALVFPSDFINRSVRGSDKKELRQIKFLPTEFEFEGSYHIVDNKFMIWNPVIPRVTVIDDPIYARMFRNIFEIIWERV